MAKFIVTGEVTISVHTVVEAKNEKEARVIATGRVVQGLCHQCADSRSADEEWRTSGELDGEPTNLSAERL